jgi:predicted kinase
MAEFVIFVGLQASGKSTFFRERFAFTHDLVSKDRFRNNRDPARRQRLLLQTALAAGRPVVVDNTNPTLEDRRELIDLARAHGAEVVGYYFDSPLEGCLERNRLRHGKAHVPDVALFAAQKRLHPPSPAEGFDRLYLVRLLSPAGFEVLPWKEDRSGAV